MWEFGEFYGSGEENLAKVRGEFVLPDDCPLEV
jgi:hypothetical protein